MRAGGSCQGRGDGGGSPGLHGAKPRKVGETGSPALTAGGRSPRKPSIPRRIHLGAFFLLDTINGSRPACLVRAPTIPRRQEPKTSAKTRAPLSSGMSEGKAKLSAIPFLNLVSRCVDAPLTGVVSPACRERGCLFVMTFSGRRLGGVQLRREKWNKTTKQSECE